MILSFNFKGRLQARQLTFCISRSVLLTLRFRKTARNPILCTYHVASAEEMLTALLGGRARRKNVVHAKQDSRRNLASFSRALTQLVPSISTQVTKATRKRQELK